jgi:Tol biopolymer transport system component
MMLRAALTATVVALAAAVGGSTAANGPSGMLAFASGRNGCENLGTDIYLLDAATGAATRLTQTCFDGDPTWSPDGGRIAFVSRRDGFRAQIWSMAADGSDARPVTTAASYAEAPDWSTRGVIAYDELGGGIWTVSPDGSGAANISSDGLGPAWSPDGGRIAYWTRSTASAPAAVWVMDANGANAHRIATGSTPAFSPDGTQLAWGLYDGAGAHLVLGAADGTNARTVATFAPGTSYRYDAMHPSWSRDGGWITFDGGDGQEVYAVPSSGGPPVRLTLHAALDTDASWRPAVPSTGLVLKKIRFAQRACATRPGKATVTVTDAQGRPLAGAAVAVSRSSARTNAAGVATVAPKVARRHRGRLALTFRAGLTGRPSATKRVSLPACR